jgi:hypothetical protein
MADYDDKKFTDMLFKISRSQMEHKPTLEEIKLMLTDARDEARRFIGTKGEVQVLEVMLDRLKQGDEYRAISGLAHMFWFYFRNSDAATKEYMATLHAGKPNNG